jgi:hypothetical protein
MRRRPADPYVRPVKVTIEFEQPSAEHWTGSLRDGSSDGPAVRFEGRLQLLRLLEAMIERTHTDFDGSNE